MRLSVRLSHACFVTNPKNLPAIFKYRILITANMQSETGFPSSHQLKYYVASKSHLKLAVRCPVSGCWPSCHNSRAFWKHKGAGIRMSVVSYYHRARLHAFG